MLRNRQLTILSSVLVYGVNQGSINLNTPILLVDYKDNILFVETNTNAYTFRLNDQNLVPVLVPVFPPYRYKSMESFTIILLQNKLVQTDTNLCKPVETFI